MDRGAWRATVHGVTKTQTRLRDWQSTFSAEGFTWVTTSSFSLAVAAPSMLQEARARAKLTGAPGPTPAPGSPAKAALLCVEPPQRLGHEARSASRKAIA